MRLTTKTALAIPGTAMLILAGATGASAADNWTMKLTDDSRQRQRVELDRQDRPGR